MKSQLHNCYICEEGRGSIPCIVCGSQFRFVSLSGPRLVDSVGFLVVSLTPLAPPILPPPLPQDSPTSAECLAVGLCIYSHELLGEC